MKTREKLSYKDLEILYETESLPKAFFNGLYASYETLGSKLYNFRESVIKKHNIFLEE
jgi:hypothetical protein